MGNVSRFLSNEPDHCTVLLLKPIKVALYSFTIARALGTKAKVICARSKENVSVFRYFIAST